MNLEIFEILLDVMVDDGDHKDTHTKALSGTIYNMCDANKCNV